MIPSNYFPLVYNPLDYINDLIGLSITEADLRYNRKYATNYSADLYITGNIFQNGNAISLDYISGITPGTAISSKALVVDVNRNINNINTISTNSIIIGTNTANANLIRFSGTAGDETTNMTVIAERIYSGSENSELLLFKGNDIPSPSGPDRIRLRAAEHRFQTYTDFEDYSALNDNNTRLFIQNNGNIGINNTSPTQTLDITGTLKASGNLTISAHDGVSNGLKLGNTLVTATASELNYVDTIVGTAQASKALVLDSNRDISNIRNFKLTGSLSTSKIANINDVDVIFITNDFRVGINKDNPQFGLDVWDAINSDTNIICSASGSGFIQNDGIVNLETQISSNNAVIGTSTNHNLHFKTNNVQRLFINNNGNVGIGISNPGCLLDVNGFYRVRSTVASAPTSGIGLEFVYSSSQDIGYIYSFDRSLNQYKTLNLNDNIAILGTGNVGIGLTNPSTKLQVSGNILNSGDITTSAGDIVLDQTKSIIFARNTSTKDANSFIGTDTGDTASLVIASARGDGNIILRTNHPTGKCIQINNNNGTNDLISGFPNNRIGINQLISATSLSYNLDINGSLNTSTIFIGGSQVNSTAAEINYLDLATGPGTAEASKALVLDASRNITNINRLLLSNNDSTTLSGITTANNFALSLYNSSNTNGQLRGCGIAFSSDSVTTNIPQAAIWLNRISSTQGELILGTRDTVNNLSEIIRCRNSGAVNINSSGTSRGILNVWGLSTFVEGATQITASFQNTDSSSIVQLQQGATESYFGTRTNHKFHLMSNNINRLTVDSTGRVGINNVSPVGQLEVFRSGTIARFTDGTCNMDIWCNTGGIFGRQAFIGPSSADALVLQTDGIGRVYIQPSDGYMAIGNGQALFPLHVLSTVTTSISSYGFLNSGGSTGSVSGSSGSTTFSARFAGRIICQGEVNVTSDKRKKKDIGNLNLSEARRFINIINPKRFIYNNENRYSYGYIAQELLKKDFNELVNSVPDNDMEEYIDEDKFVSPKGHSFTVETSNVIAFLHTVIKDLMFKHELFEERISTLEKKNCFSNISDEF